MYEYERNTCFEELRFIFFYLVGLIFMIKRAATTAGKMTARGK
jgi:hypothetical protein